MVRTHGKYYHSILSFKGMIIHGSFTENSFDRFYLSNENREMETLKDRNIYIWIRRFKI